MSTVIAAPAAVPTGPPNRRLIAGLVVSLLLHALVLSLQFGIPGLRPGPGGALTVHLAPLPANPVAQPAPETPPTTLPPPALPPQATLPPAPAPAPLLAQPQSIEPVVPAPRPRQGFSLLDPPRPQPAPPPPAIRPRRAPRRRARARAPATHDGLHTKVIAQDVHRDDSFSIPPAAIEPLPDLDPGAMTAQAQASPDAPVNAPVRQADTPPGEPEQQSAAAPATQAQAQAQEQEPEPDRQAERERLAAEREQARAARREEEDEQALRAAADLDARRAADQQARALAQENARYEDELASRARQADEEQQRLAREQAERERARQLAEQQRIQAEQERAQQLAEQQRTQQLAEQQRIQAEQQRAQQLAEQQRAQQLAEQQRAQQLAEQQRAQQQAEQQRAQQLAEQQRAQQLAEQQRARLQAEQLARDQAEQAERIARQEQASRQRDSGIEPDGLARAGAADNSGLDGVGRGAGTLPRGGLDSPLASRARELLRGIDLDKPVPQAVRPAEDARRDPRRALADAVLHDVPLRMYIDSIRQKIERNAILSPSQLATDAVRIFPVVSVTVRSDGSIEDVAIVRSSGRPDIDEVVRRIVHLNARYAAFPPNVAAHYDVVELRRVWSFAGALHLLEEMR